MCYNTYRGKEDFAYEKYLKIYLGDRYLTSISVISTIDRAHNIYKSSQRWLDFSFSTGTDKSGIIYHKSGVIDMIKKMVYSIILQ